MNPFRRVPAILYYPFLLVLLLLIGVPLWVKEKITGTQEGWLMDFYSRILGDR